MAASFSHRGGGAPLARRLWWIPAIRRAIAVTPGVLATAPGTHRAALVNFLGIYWLFSALRRDQDAVTARAHPSLQQQVTQGLSVVKIGILLASWHRRPGPGRGARAPGLLPAVTLMTTPLRATVA